MSLPKPLIIVLIVIVVLTVVSCGMTVLGSSEQGHTDAQRNQDARNSNFTDFFSKFGPPSKPVGPGEMTTDCGTPAPGRLTVSFPECSVVVAGTDEARRQLLLRPIGTPDVTMKVFSHAAGHDSESDTQTITADSDDGSLVLARNDSATIVIGCGSTCVVAVNPSPTPSP